mgnify:CR=1 FL=1
MSKIGEGKKIYYEMDMPFPNPRFALYYAIQFEDSRVHDESLYLECLEVLYKYDVRQRPKDKEVNHG